MNAKNGREVSKMTEMLYAVEMREQHYQPVMSVRTVSSLGKLPTLIGECYERIMQFLKEMDVNPCGPPFVCYYNLDMEHLDVEIGFPVDDVLPGEGDLCPSQLMEGKMVSYLYRGPYEKMNTAYDHMNEFIREHGLKPKGMSYEIYYNSPMDVQSSEELLTRIELPVE